MSQQQIDDLTKEINRLADSYYEQTSDIGKELNIERSNRLQKERSKLIGEIK